MQTQRRTEQDGLLQGPLSLSGNGHAPRERPRAQTARPGVSWSMLFVNLPDIASYQRAWAHPQNIGVRYLTAVLREHGYVADMVDVFLDACDLEEVLFLCDREECERRLRPIVLRKMVNRLKSMDWARCVLGFTTSYHHIELTLEAARAIKEVFPQAVILLGGVFATLCGAEILRDYRQVDYVLAGEAELSILLFMEALEGRKRREEVPGLVYRRDGHVERNAFPNVIADLDSLPRPALDGIGAIYRRNSDRLRLSSSRGCYGRCSFCSISAFNQLQHCSRPRMQSAERVAQEIAFLYHAWGIRRFVFSDANFMGSGQRGRQRVRQFAECLRALRLPVSFKIDARAADVDTETLATLQQAGLYMVEMGVESFCDETLRHFNKGITARRTMEAIDLLCDHGVEVMVSYIFYTPWLTLRDISDTLPIIKHYLQQPRVQWFPVFKSLKPMWGTPLFQYIEDHFVTRGNYLSYDFRIADDYIEDIRRRHTAFTNQVEWLLDNTPPLGPSGDDPFVASQYRSIQETLKVQCVTFLEDLLESHERRIEDHLRLFGLHRDRLRSLYDRTRTRGTPSAPGTEEITATRPGGRVHA